MQPHKLVTSLLLAITALLFGCSCGNDATSKINGPTTNDNTATHNTLAPPDTSPLGGTRPALVKIPDSYDPKKPLPLIVALHGYGANAAIFDIYFQLTSKVDELDYILILPEGTSNSQGRRFWDATPMCCNFEGPPVDDVAYIASLITEAQERFAIDETQVALVGHSNGGFMAYRMGCDKAEVFTHLISLAGATFKDATRCHPSRSLNVLQIHGTNDDIISYKGNQYLPSAEETAMQWVTLNECPENAWQKQDNINIAEYHETSVYAAKGCKNDTQVVLWTIQEADHIPIMSSTMMANILKFIRGES